MKDHNLSVIISALTLLAAFAYGYGTLNQKVTGVTADVSEMKPALFKAQTDLAVIKAVLVPKGMSVKSSDDLP